MTDNKKNVFGQGKVAVNLMDEARKKGVRVDVAALSRHLGVPVLGCCARKGKGVRELLTAARQVMDHPPMPRRAVYPRETEETAAELARALVVSSSALADSAARVALVWASFRAFSISALVGTLYS